MDTVPANSPVMVDAEEAERTLPVLLDRVQHGEVFVITRGGLAVARLLGGSGHDVVRAREALERLTALRKQLAARGVRVTQEEIRAMRDEGRR